MALRPGPEGLTLSRRRRGVSAANSKFWNTVLFCHYTTAVLTVLYCTRVQSMASGVKKTWQSYEQRDKSIDCESKLV